VLDTTELLECILSHLPPKQIFGVQRVAQLWKDVIARSPGIQEKLLLKLQNKPAELWALFEYDLRCEDARMKVRMERITPDVKPNLCYGTAGGRKFTPVVLNPFLQLVKGPNDEAIRNTICDRARYRIPEITQFCNGLAFDLNSNLLDTYVSDPPCTRAHVAFKYLSRPPKPDFHRLETYVVVQTGGPLTLRDVIAETWFNVAWVNRKATVIIYDEEGLPDQDEHFYSDPELDDEDEDEVPEPASLADIIHQLEAKSECKVISDPESSVVKLDSHDHEHFGPFPVVPTGIERDAVVSHDKEAYALLMAAIEVEKKEQEAERKKRNPPMAQSQLDSLQRLVHQHR